MRFAYIDSQGKEVGIPTVEALQLRIELGAIVASTMFFDASSERWAPAREHEIFRSLQREASETKEMGFVAPPPVLEAPPHASAVPSGSGPITDPFEDPDPGAGETLSSAPPLDPGLRPPDDRAPKGQGDVLSVREFTLAPLEDFSQPLSEQVDDTPPQGVPLHGAFEPTSLASAHEPAPDASAPAPEPGLELGSVIDVGPLAPSGGGGDDPDMSFEVPLAEQGLPGEASSWKGVVDLEPRTPVLAGEGPPGWADEDAARKDDSPSQREDALPAGGTTPRPARSVPETQVAARAPSEARPAVPRREPRSRPLNAPRPAPTRVRSGPAMAGAGLLIAALLGGAGWFGWSLLRGRDAAPASAYEPVEIPVLPADLEASFRELAGVAFRDAADSLSARYQAAGLPLEPPADWLAGQYLANASRYPDVAAYWQSLSDLLARLRADEASLFRVAFEARMDEASLASGDRTALLDRAVAGFRSALPERDRSYEQLAAVFAASLGLHDFLLDNEDNIDYEPAAGGISRDPVLEAVPTSRALGDEMWQRVDRITSALEAMDALSDRVTTERLFSRTLERVAATAVH